MREEGLKFATCIVEPDLHGFTSHNTFLAKLEYMFRKKILKSSL